MALMAQKTAPAVPTTRGINEKASAEFTALKHNLDSMPSWSMSPNNWDAIQIAYPFSGKEQQARSFISAVQVPTPEM
jgi:hypothetical protein